jgi:hypothetical protein
VPWADDPSHSSLPEILEPGAPPGSQGARRRGGDRAAWFLRERLRAKVLALVVGINRLVPAGIYSRIESRRIAPPGLSRATPGRRPTTYLSFKMGPTQTPVPRSVVGVNRIGESAAIGSTLAIANAVLDTRELAIPLTADPCGELSTPPAAPPRGGGRPSDGRPRSPADRAARHGRQRTSPS